MPRKLPGSFVDAISEAFEGSPAKEKQISAFSLGLAQYVTSLDSSKASFNRACREAIRAGANKDMINIIQKMANNKYGDWCWSAYGDIIIYGSSRRDAAVLATVDPRDVNWMVNNCPINVENKPLYENHLPRWLTKEREE